MADDAATSLSSSIAGEADGAGSTEAPEPSAGRPRKKWSWWKKTLIIGAISTPILIGALWVAVHSIPWMGPLVANTLRAIIGKENVTRLEEFAYSVEDRVNRTVKKGDKPKAYWKVPEQKSTEAAPASSAATDVETPEEEAELPPFAPPAPGPVHQSWSAEGDGQWVPVVDPRRPEEEPRMFKTLLHPDSSRSWAELFVVAVDLRSVRVMPVMGYQEPRTEKPEAENYERHAKIPEKHHEALLAAFNGGFMAEHGRYGVYFDDVLFIDPKDDACTLAHYEDGSFRIASWSKIKDGFSDMRWFRQAPNCMYEEGEMHPNLKIHRARKWGATLDGNTVIRRSAVGLSRDREILYVGISNHTTAKAMALGMHHAGGYTVAQMDVNWSYPKFVTFEQRKDGLLHPVALAEGFEFSDGLYLREREMRDFFYLVRKEEVPAPGGASKPDDESKPNTAPTETSTSDAPSPDEGDPSPPADHEQGAKEPAQ